MSAETCTPCVKVAPISSLSLSLFQPSFHPKDTGTHATSMHKFSRRKLFSITRELTSVPRGRQDLNLPSTCYLSVASRSKSMRRGSGTFGFISCPPSTDSLHKHFSKTNQGTLQSPGASHLEASRVSPGIPCSVSLTGDTASVFLS